jgi:hypothetical protein
MNNGSKTIKRERDRLLWAAHEGSALWELVAEIRDIPGSMAWNEARDVAERTLRTLISGSLVELYETPHHGASGIELARGEWGAILKDAKEWECPMDVNKRIVWARSTPNGEAEIQNAKRG